MKPLNSHPPSTRSPFDSANRKTLCRRSFLKLGAMGTVGMAVSTGRIARTAAGGADRYEGLDSQKYFGKVQVETKIEDKDIFTEGPAVDRAGNVFFTNVPVSKILKWNPTNKQLSVFRENSHKTNGLFFDPHGHLLACEGGTGRITRTDMKTGKITVLAETYRGFPFAAPNDLCLDAKGRIYFTSRPGVADPAKGNVNAFYRVDADGRVTQLMAFPKTQMPNGIVTSSDDRTLYVIEAHPDAGHARNIQAYGLSPEGTVSNSRTHINFYPGRSGDGMCIDAQDNLYVAAGLHKRRGTSETLDTRPGIHVVSKEGKLVAYAQTPVDTITNCTFGGEDLRTLYITCGNLLLSLRTQIAGKASYRPMA